VTLTENQLDLLFRLAQKEWPYGLKCGLKYLHRLNEDEYYALVLGRMLVEKNGRIFLGAAGRKALLDLIREGQP
jgi:hypothetical protein